jgi:hypothetical protein
MIAIMLAALLNLEGAPSATPQEPSPTAVSPGQEDMTYFQEAQTIWRTFVPASGQADTVQGELLRAVEKLRDESMRNGNGNWDDGFEILLAYLGAHLDDPQVFDVETRRRTAVILERLGRHKTPVLADEPFDELADRVVDYYRHYGSRPHTPNPALHR